MIRILIVEDEVPISDLLKITLSGEGYSCTCAYDGLKASEILAKEQFDLVLLDVMLPGIDGFELMEYIRSIDTPVIFITAKSAVADRVRGLKLGAEDYIIKPFEILELLARVEGVLRRHGKLDDTIQIGGLTINAKSMVVLRDGIEIPLTKKEYEILLLFARNPGIVLYKSQIYERVWGDDYPDSTRTVELHVQRMKKKVGWQDMIKPVFALGYRLEVLP